MTQHNVFHTYRIGARVNAPLQRWKNLIKPCAIGSRQVREKYARVDSSLLATT